MRKKIPRPLSGGLILSYKCPSECRHCIYGCTPEWSADWMSERNLELILSSLSGKIMPATYGPRTTGLNHGLHITGGEPFLNFELLLKAVDTADRLDIPSTFVETNCFWCVDDKSTKEKMRLLKKTGLRGIMISVNPFYLEFVPFERTERAVRMALDIFGKNVMVYQVEYYRKFLNLGISGTVSFDDYISREGANDFAANAEFMVMGRAPYRLGEFLRKIHVSNPADYYFNEPCMPPFLRGLHNHFDNYGNYIPGFCGGISYGDCRRLDELLNEGVDTEQFPVLSFLLEEDLKGLYDFTRDRGYTELSNSYLSKCHLCTDIRKHLALNWNFSELTPKEFYLHLN